ncbi:odorant receptor 67b-like isoform X5 [Bombus affinis]|uniref:odorant receptor 67b-like isoform X5 n=1 Tax=Bombus affinis TaxID=309941 RepID=UPI0021B7F118|nr:odorant receptor 67b-like isoform X5 [Bombus affinis]
MDKATVVNEYMKVVKICTMMGGIWPDQSKVSKLVMRMIIYIVIVISLVTQMANVVRFYSLQTVVEQVCFFNAMAGALLKQGNYIVNAAEYKMLLTAIWKDWSTDRLIDESDIMVEYAKRGAFFSRLYCGRINHIEKLYFPSVIYFIHRCHRITGLGVFCAVCFIQLSLSPYILDIISPNNETRDLIYIYPAYYYIDDRKYRTFISFHMTYTVISTFFVFVGCDASYIYMVQHACGQLAVAGHRFKNALSDLSIDNEKGGMQDKSYERVLHSIREHQYATNYLKSIQTSHSVYLCICIGMSMASFTVSLVKVASQSEISGVLIKDSVFLLSQLIHILLLTVQGQFVLNSNDEIIESIYDASWYNANKKTQLLFLLSIRSCLSPPILSAGGLLDLNLKNFAEASFKNTFLK